MMLILNVLYVLIAIAIIALVLMQRGSGAQAGSGFGAGASGTVFGARGASNFLSKSTKWLAIAFFGITLFMAWHASHSGRQQSATQQADLGVMGQPAGNSPTAPAAGEMPAQPSTVPSVPLNPPTQAPAAPASTVPANTAPATTTPAPQPSEQAAPPPAQNPQAPAQGG